MKVKISNCPSLSANLLYTLQCETPCITCIVIFLQTRKPWCSQNDRPPNSNPVPLYLVSNGPDCPLHISQLYWKNSFWFTKDLDQWNRWNLLIQLTVLAIMLCLVLKQPPKLRLLRKVSFLTAFPLLLSYAVPVKSKGNISQNFMAFSEYMNFN